MLNLYHLLFNIARTLVVTEQPDARTYTIPQMHSDDSQGAALPQLGNPQQSTAALLQSQPKEQRRSAHR